MAEERVSAGYLAGGCNVRTEHEKEYQPSPFSP